MKKIISFILMTVVVGTALSGCSHISDGSKNDYNIDSQTKETSELKSANDSSPAESSAENSTGSSLPFIHLPKITMEEAQNKAKKLKAECEKRLAESGISDDDYSYGYIVRNLTGIIYESPDLSDDEILDEYVYEICISVKSRKIMDIFLDKHSEIPEKRLDEENRSRLYYRINKMCYAFPDLNEERYIDMLEYPIKNYPDIAYDFDYSFPMQEAQIARVDFDSTKRITTEDIISICDSAKIIKDIFEREEYIKQELLKKQAYPDYTIDGYLYFFDHSNDINDTQNTKIDIFKYKYPFGYYDMQEAKIYYTTTDENGNEIREYFSTTAEY